jgi:hypothetical protein
LGLKEEKKGGEEDREEGGGGGGGIYLRAVKLERIIMLAGEGKSKNPLALQKE